MTSTPHLGLPFIEGGQAQKHVTHNEALRVLDAAIQIAVLDVTRNAPPAGPAEGQRHVVAAAPTGAWTGHACAIATWQDGAWAFLTPHTGWCIWSVADDGMMVFDGSAWRDLRSLALDNAAHLGVNTTASAPNLLSVKSNAALLAAINVADGGSGDVRLQLSKEAAANTASVLFADNFSGRAEFGLVGSDAFKLKVSVDGMTWVEALAIDQSTGNLSLPRGLALSGVIAPPTITANQNDYTPAGLDTACVLQLASDAARTLSGLAGGAEGRVVSLVNTGSQPLILLDDSASSSAANRFTLAGNLTLLARQAVMLRYDSSAARWQGIAGSFGLRAANNLADLTSASEARGNLGVRDVLGAARSYYVRSDGNDANNGLANTTGGAFLTIQRAVDAVCAIDMSVYQATIQIADGSYTGVVQLKRWQGALPPIIQGNNATPANVLVSTSGASAFTNDGNPAWIIHDLKIQTATAGRALHASNGGVIRFGNINFGAIAQQAVLADSLGSISADGNFAVSGSALCLAQAAAGQVAISGRTVTFSGTVAYSLGSIVANRSGGNVDCYGMTFSNGGIVTGPRYSASGNGTITVAGAGATYLPGNSAGTTATGGQYW